MITAIQQKKSHLWMYLFGGLTNIFALLTVFGSLFPLFCDALHMSKTRIGFILSLLPLSYLVSVFVYRGVMRLGPKKALITFYFIRYWFILGLPLAVGVARRFGDNAAFIWVAVCILFFGILRSIAETGWWPWWMELIPSKTRGKVEAANSVVVNIASVFASLAAVLIMKKWEGIFGYSVAIYLGLIFGFIGLAMAWRLPGGQPQDVEKRNWSLVADTLEAFRNRRFSTWIKSVMFVTLGFAIFGFLPLYLNGRVGFSADRIMLFSGCYQGGVLISAFFWGWSADRFGSKPVCMSALMGLCLVPVCLFLLPRLDQQSVILTGSIYVFFGIVLQGWMAGASRYFYVTVLPTAANPAFCTALNTTIQNVQAACCALLYGWLLDAVQSLRFDWRFIHFDNFSVLFILLLVCVIIALCIFRGAHEDTGVRTGEFMSFFFEGNPLLAFSSILRYHNTEDEERRLELTRQMGDSQSHLTVEELLQAVDDPSFSVRYEAIVSMARMPPDAKLIAALSTAVKSREPGLSEAAVWALGRMGDRRAVPVLREMLKSEYALLRSQSARSLAKLNDEASTPEIEAAFRHEPNVNIRCGYAAALGLLRRKEMLPDLLDLLKRLVNERMRGEVALAIARITGGEHHFIKLWRRSRSDFETACAEMVMEIENKIAGTSLNTAGCRQLAKGCIKSFEQHNLREGVNALRGLVAMLPPKGIDPAVKDILRECDAVIVESSGSRGDSILLALNALYMAVVFLARDERKKKLSSAPDDAYDAKPG